ncbi:MAG: helix-turn-helix transcriptional regulator [Bacteroidia bacterium]|nr:helix-turn-helix transcriptional regulator [Bacteroidia bacterium]
MRSNTFNPTISSQNSIMQLNLIPEKIKVLIVDDHQMIRDGIRIMLESKAETYKFIVSESENGEDAIHKVQKNDYDVILMDYQMPGLNGAETISNILIYKPHMKILALSNHNELGYIKKTIDSGAKGYILKNIGPTELCTAISTILNGKLYYANDVALKLIHQEQPADDKKLELSTLKLTNREIEVLLCIAEKLSDKQIAKKLNISIRTVISHRGNMINKLGLKNSAGLFNYANELKLNQIHLSKREIEILRYIANEYTNKEIGEKLFISTRTVDVHRQNLMYKLGAKNTVSLVKFAIHLKLI